MKGSLGVVSTQVIELSLQVTVTLLGPIKRSDPGWFIFRDISTLSVHSIKSFDISKEDPSFI